MCRRVVRCQEVWEVIQRTGDDPNEDTEDENGLMGAQLPTPEPAQLHEIEGTMASALDIGGAPLGAIQVDKSVENNSLLSPAHLRCW